MELSWAGLGFVLCGDDRIVTSSLASELSDIHVC